MNRIPHAVIAAVIVALGFLGPSIAGAQTTEEAYGVSLPPEAKMIDEGRYRSAQDYRRTIRYYSRRFGPSTRRNRIWRPIRGSARIKGVHIVNNAPSRKWDAINIYERGSKVFIYVIEAAEAEEKSS